MKVEIVVSRRVERLYKEYMTFIESLNGKTKEERFELYESMTRRLYPHAKKVVDLEDQLIMDVIKKAQAERRRLEKCLIP